MERFPGLGETGPEVRALMRAKGAATLATQLVGSGWPYASLVLVATATDGAPLLLLSRLAEHTKNIAGDARVSLLFDATEPGAGRLAGARATVLGRAMRSDSHPELRRFLARHPEAVAYASFADFGLYRVQIDRAHLVAGFGRIHWVDVRDILLPGELAAGFGDEAAAIDAINRDPGLVRSLAAPLAPGDIQGDWSVTGCDPDGCDACASDGRIDDGRRGEEAARIAFAGPIPNAAGAFDALRRLAGPAA